MSRSINDSLQLLSETLGNCKTNLTEKKVENVDNIKISDVDEKILEIKADGPNPFTLVKDVKVSNTPINSAYIRSSVTLDFVSTPIIEFTVGDRDVHYKLYPEDIEIQNEEGNTPQYHTLNKNTKYKILSKRSYTDEIVEYFFVYLMGDHGNEFNLVSFIDCRFVS